MLGSVWHNRDGGTVQTLRHIFHRSLLYRCGDRYGTTGDGGMPAAVPSSETPTALMPQVPYFFVSFLDVFFFQIAGTTGDGGTLAPVLSSEILTALMKQVA